MLFPSLPFLGDAQQPHSLREGSLPIFITINYFLDVYSINQAFNLFICPNSEIISYFIQSVIERHLLL